MADMIIIYDIHSATDSTDPNKIQCVLLYGNKTVPGVYMKKTALKTFFDAGIPILNSKNNRYTKFDDLFKLK